MFIFFSFRRLSASSSIQIALRSKEFAAVLARDRYKYAGKGSFEARRLEPHLFLQCIDELEAARLGNQSYLRVECWERYLRRVDFQYNQNASLVLSSEELCWARVPPRLRTLSFAETFLPTLLSRWNVTVVGVYRYVVCLFNRITFAMRMEPSR